MATFWSSQREFSHCCHLLYGSVVCLYFKNMMKRPLLLSHYLPITWEWPINGGSIVLEHVCVLWCSYCQPKPWTPEIFLECYCVARKKLIIREKTKPQARTLISLWFCGLLAYHDLCCDWSPHNKHSWNISSVHSFVGLTAKLELLILNYFTGNHD